MSWVTQINSKQSTINKLLSSFVHTQRNGNTLTNTHKTENTNKTTPTKHSLYNPSFIRKRKTFWPDPLSEHPRHPPEATAVSPTLVHVSWSPHERFASPRIKAATDYWQENSLAPGSLVKERRLMNTLRP